MADEKKYTAREAAVAVLKKAEELLKGSELLKADKDKSVTQQMLSDETHKKLTQGFPDKAPSDKMKAFMQGKKGLKKAEEPKGEIHPKEHVEGESEKPGARIESQKDPQDNPKEQAEGNNELAGTTPNQVGQDGKNLPGADEQMTGHLKLAKFIGRMEHKRNLRKMGNG